MRSDITRTSLIALIGVCPLPIPKPGKRMIHVDIINIIMLITGRRNFIDNQLVKTPVNFS